MSHLYNPVLRIKAPEPTGMTEDQIIQANISWDRRWGKPPYANRMADYMIPSPPNLDKTLLNRELDGIVHAWHAKLADQANVLPLVRS